MGTNKERAFTVNMWWTNLHDVEFGFFIHSRYRAKSRQFTQDSDVIGEILENGERSALITYRDGLWKSDKPTEKRLVFKLFTPSMNWRASLDLLTGHSVQLTLGAGGFPVPAYSGHIEGYEHNIQLERSARKWPWQSEQFTFFLMENEELRVYRLRRHLFSLGGSYTVYNQLNEKIGEIKGNIWRAGGRWYVTLAQSCSKELALTLQLACAMIKFNRAARRHVKRVTQEVEAGATKLAIEKQEADLYLNPRRAH